MVYFYFEIKHKEDRGREFLMVEVSLGGEYEQWIAPATETDHWIGCRLIELYKNARFKRAENGRYSMLIHGDISSIYSVTSEHPTRYVWFYRDGLGGDGICLDDSGPFYKLLKGEDQHQQQQQQQQFISPQAFSPQVPPPKQVKPTTNLTTTKANDEIGVESITIGTKQLEINQNQTPLTRDGWDKKTKTVSSVNLERDKISSKKSFQVIMVYHFGFPFKIYIDLSFQVLEFVADINIISFYMPLLYFKILSELIAFEYQLGGRYNIQTLNQDIHKLFCDKYNLSRAFTFPSNVTEFTTLPSKGPKKDRTYMLKVCTLVTTIFDFVKVKVSLGGDHQEWIAPAVDTDHWVWTRLNEVYQGARFQRMRYVDRYSMLVQGALSSIEYVSCNNSNKTIVLRRNGLCVEVVELKATIVNCSPIGGSIVRDIKGNLSKKLCSLLTVKKSLPRINQSLALHPLNISFYHNPFDTNEVRFVDCDPFHKLLAGEDYWSVQDQVLPQDSTLNQNGESTVEGIHDTGNLQTTTTTTTKSNNDFENIISITKQLEINQNQLLSTRDDWDKNTKEVVVGPSREGQEKFKRDLSSHYGLSCMATGSSLACIIEACHIYPYSKGGMNLVSNGLLLTVDLHRLLDAGKWIPEIDQANKCYIIKLGEEMANEERYKHLNNTKLGGSKNSSKIYATISIANWVHLRNINPF
ncbi:hypothetical protein DFA_02895 [Cavenderia fasciculata]|uniref:HNH nuclease domain-containing protein n=1 Tax=Cavenderia fasciculata TaxID=261658 RepID=F4PIS2_CACFS|nr:uncharacterized protein DFA_02895 [Cavenderia fasciculata]EGG24651.1 hypothetical protein DFA_02895 [Cavenderia fasciculata]|eukprot:XP_004362502.1 hypothetical protein DFA_02895 [Cavenderia fasciculata]